MDLYYNLEVEVGDLPPWVISGREQGARVQLTCGKAIVWMDRDDLAGILFPSTLVHTFRVQCTACRSAVVKIEVASLESFKALVEAGPILCRDCQKMADIAASGVQAIGPR